MFAEITVCRNPTVEHSPSSATKIQLSLPNPRHSRRGAGMLSVIRHVTKRRLPPIPQQSENARPNKSKNGLFKKRVMNHSGCAKWYVDDEVNNIRYQLVTARKSEPKRPLPPTPKESENTQPERNNGEWLRRNGDSHSGSSKWHRMVNKPQSWPLATTGSKMNFLHAEKNERNLFTFPSLGFLNIQDEQEEKSLYLTLKKTTMSLSPWCRLPPESTAAISDQESPHPSGTCTVTSRGRQVASIATSSINKPGHPETEEHLNQMVRYVILLLLPQLLI